MSKKIILGHQPNQATRIILKHQDKYVCSIYRSDIVYCTRMFNARQYKSRTYINHICEKLNLRPEETDIMYINVDTKTGEILKVLQ